MLSHSPPSHRVSRLLLGLLLIAASLAAVAGLVLTGTDAWLFDSGKRIIEEVRRSWAS